MKLQEEKVKQRIIKISPFSLVSLFQENNKIGIKEGIPAGTKFIGGGYDAATNSFFLHIENPRFEETNVGERLPVQPILLIDLGETVKSEKLQSPKVS